MRFVVGEVIVDDDDFELPLREFLPGLDLAALGDQRGLLEPDFVDLAGNAMKCVIQTFVLRLGGRTLLINSCIGEQKDRPEIPAWNRPSCADPELAAETRRRLLEEAAATRPAGRAGALSRPPPRPPPRDRRRVSCRSSRMTRIRAARSPSLPTRARCDTPAPESTR